jgi:hypothetical protein
VAPMIGLPLVSIEPHAVGRNIVGNQLMAGSRVHVITHPETLLTRLPRHHTDDGSPIIGVCAMSLPLFTALPLRVSGITMGCAFFPRVLVQLIRLEGGAGHHGCWGRRIQIGLDTLPQSMQLLPGQAQLAR